jgi:hypothetical protein
MLRVPASSRERVQISRRRTGGFAPYLANSGATFTGGANGVSQFDAGSVWVTNADDRTVTRIDAVTGADGLSRFDGYTFTNYGTEQGLPHANVTDLLETRSGEYWVATYGGIALFNPKGAPANKVFYVGDRPIDLVAGEIADQVGQFAFFRGEEASETGLDNLRQCTARERHDRSPARHRLDRHHAKRLFAAERKERTGGLSEETILLVVIDHADVTNLIVEKGCDRALEEIRLDDGAGEG